MKPYRKGFACGIGAPSYFSFDSNRFASVDGLKLRHRNITPGEEGLGGYVPSIQHLVFVPKTIEDFDIGWGWQLHELGHAFGLANMTIRTARATAYYHRPMVRQNPIV